MKKRMLIAGLLAIAMLLISCGAESDTSVAVPDQSDDGSSAAVMEASSAGTTGASESEAETSSFESSNAAKPDESSEASSDESSAADEPEPVESSVDDPSQSEGSSKEPAESSKGNAPGTESSETSKPQPTGTGTHKHSYKDTVVKPTCTEKGYTLHKCSCGESYTDNETDALGHLMIVGLDAPNRKKPTDTTRGMSRIGCDNCDYYEDRETYSYNEVAPLIAERILYYLNLYRKEAGVAPVALSNKLSEYAQYRSKQTYSHDKVEQQIAADATQCGDFYEYSDTSWWTVSCAEVITRGPTTFAVDGSGITIDDAAKGVIADYRGSSAHWKILMNPDYTYIGVGHKGHNCIVLCNKSYDDGYKHVWDFGDGNYGSEWVPR